MKTVQEATVVIQARDVGLNQGGSRVDSEKQMDYRYVIKVELTEYLDRVNVGCDRKKNEGCLNVLDLNN